MVKPKKRKELKSALKKNLIDTYLRSVKRKIVRITEPPYLNHSQDLLQYSLEELINVFIRYVYYKNQKDRKKTEEKRRPKNLPNMFELLFEHYQKWLQNFLEATEIV